MQAVNDTDTSRRELAIMISKDPSLVGSLLKLANSQYYRMNSQAVESVDRAVAVIGTEGIRSLIAAALVQPVFRVSGGEFAQFPEVIWEHTFLAANAAETYAAVVVNADPFAAQLLALVNGLGAIVVFRVRAGSVRRAPRSAAGRGDHRVAARHAHVARRARHRRELGSVGPHPRRAGRSGGRRDAAPSPHRSDARCASVASSPRWPCCIRRA